MGTGSRKYLLVDKERREREKGSRCDGCFNDWNGNQVLSVTQTIDLDVKNSPAAKLNTTNFWVDN